VEKASQIYLNNQFEWYWKAG